MKCTNCKKCTDCCVCKQCPNCSSYTTKDKFCTCCAKCEKCCHCTSSYVSSLQGAGKFDLVSELTSFYLVEELLAKLASYERDHPAQVFRLADGELNSFEEQLITFRNAQAALLAKVYFDYIAYICPGEMRHSQGPRYPNLAKDFSRESIYKQAVKYNPFEYLPRLAETFERGEWGGGYGGKPWALIAKAGCMYKQESDIVFVDHCVDLTHNNGTMLNKPVGIFKVNYKLYRNLLDRKQRGELLVNLWPKLLVLDTLSELLARAGKLGMLPPAFDWVTVEHYSYAPIEWGTTLFPPLAIDASLAERFPLNWTVTAARKGSITIPLATKDELAPFDEDQVEESDDESDDESEED